MKACLSIDLDDYGDYARLLGLHPGPTAQQTLYDDGLPRLLDVLDRHALRATFFAIGRDAAPSRHGARLRELMARGHEVANHSYDHPYDFRRLARAEKRREILDADKAIADATGRRPTGFRAPSFSIDAETLELLEEAGYAYDSSVVPSPVLWGMQLYAACLVRREGYDLGSPSVVLAPAFPYIPRAGAVWRRAHGTSGARRLLEIPCSVSPLLRVPLYGTVLRALPEGLRARCFTRRGDAGVVHALFHLLDAADPRDTPLDEALRKMPGLWPSPRRRLATLEQAAHLLLRAGAQGCTLAEVAASQAPPELVPAPIGTETAVGLSSAPLLSVVIPAHDAARTLADTLEATLASDVPGGVEVIVVDDASSDGTAALAARYPVRLERLARRGGAARARNAGARCARGEFLVFLDADVVPLPDALPRLAVTLRAGADCVIGRYGVASRATEFGSRFKNAVHCAMFDRSPAEVSWFWTGLGAVRRVAFERLGGFDEQRFGRGAGLEDLEFGVRLRRSGVAIRLDAAVRAEHDHPRTVWQVLRNDLDRAEQQVALALDRAHFTDEAFATPANAMRVAALDAALALAVLAAVRPASAVVGLAIASLAVFAALSRGNYRSFASFGAWFAVRATLLDAATVVAAQLGALATVLRAGVARLRR